MTENLQNHIKNRNAFPARLPWAWWLVWMGLWGAFGAEAQSDSLSFLREFEVSAPPPGGAVLAADSLFILPGTVVLRDAEKGDTLPRFLWRVAGKKLIWADSSALWTGAIKGAYRVLPIDLTARVSHFDSSQIRRASDHAIGIVYDPYEASPGNVLSFQKGLNYSGSFARGLSVGNNQNLVLNSNFNLQIAGDLGDGVEVVAAITDNNIPIQPEGNTQQLSEFDKIFVQITKENNQLTAGDYELSRPPGYFMNYYKKLQGGTFSRDWKMKTGGTLSSKASVAVARGKFARNAIQGQEGNQGPYRLEGAENERFIIVLAGTEKVWIDGVLMKRGVEADYIIDYNAGHITFMPKQLITKDRRIIVEFEYADQNYLRSMYALNLEGRRNEKMRFYFNVFSQQDGRRPLEGDFSASELSALRAGGDDPLRSVVSSIRREEDFSPFRVLYEVVDTLGFDSVLVFSTNEEAALFSAFFSFVGPGNGDYVIDPAQVANGRVYRWVAPQIMGDSVIHVGEYAPVRQLVAPRQQQLYTLGGAWKWRKNSGIRAEVGLSNQDENRISGLDDGDNLGLAAFTAVDHAVDFGKKEAWKLDSELSYEFAQKRFRPLNPYRNAEFARDWNLTNADPADEHILAGEVVLKNKQSGQVSYRFNSFLRGDIYRGYRHLAQYALNRKGYEILLEGNLLNANGATERSRFFRPKIKVAVPFFRDSTGRKFWHAGVYAEREKNERYLQTAAPVSDTLSGVSFWYDLYRLYIKSPDNQLINFGFQYQNRKDYAPLYTRFEATTRADDWSLTGNWNPKWKSGEKARNNNVRFDWTLTYRQLTIENEALTTQDPAETFLGKINYNFNLVNGVFQTNTTYELSGGQERKSDFVYLPVLPGEGNFVWRNDDNADGIIQPNEVEIAPFADSANVLRQVVFTDEFVRTNNILFNQSLRLEPRAIWYTEKGFRKFLSRFSTTSSLQIFRKVKDAPDVSPWNPFQLDIIDTALVATRAGIRNALLFNPNDPKFSIETGQSDNEEKNILTTGYESRRVREQFVKIRWNLTRTLATKMAYAIGRKIQDSEQFDNKDYNIRYFNLGPELTWLPVKTFRTVLKYKFENARNTLPGTDESSDRHEFALETRYNQPAKISIESRLTFSRIRFTGETNSPVGFAFLNGLQKGNNFLWNLALDRQIGRNMRLNLSYEGRKTGKGRVVHVGRVTVAATF
ncbi:MAG: hypothetical protein D6714_05560 [Bacteroidetes bacterium]|nr:MAG: hypothetical protein D6714_05560 [Bacteroidota bacterium]